jgi:FdhD protein
MNPLQQFPAQQQREGVWRAVSDALVVEEPLEIRVNSRRYSATMRTPQGDEFDRFLALGLLLGEGVITSMDDVERIECRARCRDLSEELVNVVDVTIHDESAVPDSAWQRSLISNSSCGLCGKASVEALSSTVSPLSKSAFDAELLRTLPDRMRAHQTLFEASGGPSRGGDFQFGRRTSGVFRRHRTPQRHRPRDWFRFGTRLDSRAQQRDSVSFGAREF